MTADELAAARERHTQVQTAINAVQGSWPAIARELVRIRAEKVDALVVANDEELRGAIKQIDELLQLPNNLQQELLMYAESLPE